MKEQSRKAIMIISDNTDKIGQRIKRFRSLELRCWMDSFTQKRANVIPLLSVVNDASSTGYSRSMIQSICNYYTREQVIGEGLNILSR